MLSVDDLIAFSSDHMAINFQIRKLSLRKAPKFLRATPELVLEITLRPMIHAGTIP